MIWFPYQKENQKLFFHKVFSYALEKFLMSLKIWKNFKMSEKQGFAILRQISFLIFSSNSNFGFLEKHHLVEENDLS